MSECEKEHPEIPSVRCHNTEGNHPTCTGFDRGQRQYLDWVNPDYAPPKTVDKAAAKDTLRGIAARAEPARRVEGFAAGLEGSRQAAGVWTQDQKDRVSEAIKAVALEYDEFTTDLIWAKLDGSVPVTKGMTAMLKRADQQGVLGNTGKTEISQRGGQHDHGQRLTIWYSLIRKTV